MIEVTLFGDINVDALMSIPAYPEPGGDAMAQQVVLRPGGSVANTAIVLARLDVITKMIGRVGDDAWAELALAPLINLGVDLSSVERDLTDSTGLIFIPVTAAGERTMFSYRGANTRILPEAISAEVLGQPRFLHISAYNFLKSPQREATVKAVELAKQRDIQISMDVGVEPSLRATDDLLAMLPGLGLLVLGREEAVSLVGTGDPDLACAALLAHGVNVVGLKLGNEGCQVAWDGQQALLPGWKVSTVDTTGAGDAFCAGMIYGLLLGLSLPACGLLANTLGALATTVWGGGPALPGKAEVRQFLRQRIQSGMPVEFDRWAGQVLSALDTDLPQGEGF